MKKALSEKSRSHDVQVYDVLNKLTPEEWSMVIVQFPELDSETGIIYRGDKWDHKAMGVRTDYTRRLAEFIQRNTDVVWEDGQPWRDGGEEVEQ